jgi:hypothetical protein
VTFIKCLPEFYFVSDGQDVPMLNVIAGQVVVERDVPVLFSGELDIPNAVVLRVCSADP